jgi:hypothetical protein
VKQVEAAIRKAGGNPNRILRSAGKGSGRSNAHNLGAERSASFAKESRGSQVGSAERF